MLRDTLMKLLELPATERIDIAWRSLAPKARHGAPSCDASVRDLLPRDVR